MVEKKFLDLNITVVALVALVAIVGVTAIVLKEGHSNVAKEPAGNLEGDAHYFHPILVMNDKSVCSDSCKTCLRHYTRSDCENDLMLCSTGECK